jgi:hypothetical protein
MEMVIFNFSKGEKRNKNEYRKQEYNIDKKNNKHITWILNRKKDILPKILKIYLQNKNII